MGGRMVSRRAMPRVREHGRSAAFEERKSMKALVYRAPERVEVAEVPKPRIEKPTDAILRVTTAAICGSDLHVYHGLLSPGDGLTLGHEFVGVVDELGSAVEGLAVGQRVFVGGGRGWGG